MHAHVARYLYDNGRVCETKIMKQDRARDGKGEGVCKCEMQMKGGGSDLSLVHLMVGVGSPTELQGSRTSFIQGVVTVPPKDRILAGAGQRGTGARLNGLFHPFLYPRSLLTQKSIEVMFA